MISTAIQGLDEALKALDPKQIEQAHVRATNRAIRKGRTEWNRAIRGDYAIKASDINKASKLMTARRGARRDAGIELMGPVLPLRDFGAKQTAKGVTVRIRKKGSRKLIKGAFIRQGLGGHVFKRSGDERLPIEKLFSVSVPQAADDEGNINQATAAIEIEYRKEFARLVNLFGHPL